MRRIAFVLSLLFTGAFCHLGVDAQKVRLRSQLTPDCTVVSGNPNWKFAYIWADGNLAVMGRTTVVVPSSLTYPTPTLRLLPTVMDFDQGGQRFLTENYNSFATKVLKVIKRRAIAGVC